PEAAATTSTTERKERTMLNEPTIEKLKALRLDAMASAWSEQQKDAGATKLAFDERFGLLVDAESLFRENRRPWRLLKEAKLKIVTPASRTSTTHRDASSTRRSSASSPPAAGSTSTRTSPSPARPASARPTSRAPSRSTPAVHGYSAIYRRASRLFDELDNGP